jgi:hypothetical protein
MKRRAGGVSPRRRPRKGIAKSQAAWRNATMAMTNDSSQIDALLAQARALDDGLPKLLLLEEAVRLADTCADTAQGFRIRLEAICTANFGGYPERALVAFSWCLAQLDRQPQQFDQARVLWQYKWIISDLLAFPQISLEQIHSALDDLTRRYQTAGYNMRAIHKLRYRVARRTGRTGELRRHHRAWQKTPRDVASDCPACDLNHEVAHQFLLGRDERGLERAGPLLAGKMRCATVPHSTLASVLMPLLRLGRLDEAAAYHRKGLRLIARNRNFLEDLGKHLVFQALTDNFSLATKLLQRHLPWALECTAMDERFEFFLAARLLLERLHETEQTPVVLRLPRTFAAWQKGGKYEAQALAAWFDRETLALAAQFDRRNGNDAFTRRCDRHRALKRRVTPYPL